MKNLRVIKVSLWVSLLTIFLMGSTQLNARVNVVENYLDHIRSGSTSLKIETCKKLYDYSGITDKRIFDLIEGYLISAAKVEKPSRAQTKEAVWYAKALASSGESRYEATLKVVSESASKRKLRKQAQTSLEELPRFRRWNTVINSSDFELSGRPRSLALWMRFLASDDVEMGLYAIEKSRDFANYDLNFLVMMEEKLQALYPLQNPDKETIRFQAAAMDYLMSHPEFGKYTGLINEVAEKSPNKHVAKAARKALRE